MYASNEKLMIGPKILMRQTSDRLRCCFDDESHYCQNSVFIVHSEVISLHFLLGLLNSKLWDFIYTNNNPQKGKVFAEVKPSVIKNMPVPLVNSPQASTVRDNIEKLVKNIISLRKRDPVASIESFDHEIDQLVYALYGLTPQEIAIVEGTAK